MAMTEMQILMAIERRLTTIELKLQAIEGAAPKPKRTGLDWKRIADSLSTRLAVFIILSTTGGLTVVEAVKVAFR
jgi:hypothetical protein